MPPTDSNNSKPSILKNTREAKGLTLEIVHEATKIPMDALRAIEEGYSVRILSPFYYRGFIKIYSEFLGLNVAEMYKQYGLDQPAKPAPASAPVKSSLKEPPRQNLFMEQVSERLSSVFEPKNLNLILKVTGVFLLFFLLFKVGGCVASHMHKKPVPVKRHRTYVERQTQVVIPKEAQEPQEPKYPPVTPEVKQKIVQAPSEDNKVEVAVRAEKNTWLRVKADDKVVFETTLPKGSMESWSADKRVELSGRDLEQLDMEINNKHIGLLGGGERRIRKVLITHDGLTVKK